MRSCGVCYRWSTLCFDLICQRSWNDNPNNRKVITRSFPSRAQSALGRSARKPLWPAWKMEIKSQCVFLGAAVGCLSYWVAFHDDMISLDFRWEFCNPWSLQWSVWASRWAVEQSHIVIWALNWCEFSKQCLPRWVTCKYTYVYINIIYIYILMYTSYIYII